MKKTKEKMDRSLPGTVKGQNKKQRTFKTLRRLFAVAGILVLCFGIFCAVCGCRKSDPKYSLPEREIKYFPADYEENIFENTAYMSSDRQLLFGSQSGASYVERRFELDTEREEAAEDAGFFIDYFQCLIHGEYEKIPDFFTDGFFETPPRFTMQMIHDMSVKWHSEGTETVNGVETNVINYSVSYAIYKNNGTWRTGVGNDEIRPQIYQVIRDDAGSLRIWRIMDVFVDVA